MSIQLHKMDSDFEDLIQLITIVLICAYLMVVAWIVMSSESEPKKSTYNPVPYWPAGI